jgi:K+-transporting ATPase ATPase A chain
MWFLPVLIVGLAAGLSVPLGRYMARVLDRPAAGNRIERLLDTGPQNWKQYCYSLLGFNFLAFIVGFAVLALQPYLPLNPDNKGMLAPTTIFNTAASFLTNTNLQHYSGEVHLSYFSQLFFICWKQFVGPAIGLAALLAVIRSRGCGSIVRSAGSGSASSTSWFTSSWPYSWPG